MKSLGIVLSLGLISMIAGGLLSLWDKQTAPLIEINRIKALERGIAQVLPAHDRYETKIVKDVTYYWGYDKDQTEPVGVAFSTAGPGFQGKVALMIGVKPDLTEVTGVQVISQIETPGLGTKIVVDPSNKEDKYWFSNQFKALVLDRAIEVLKNKKPSEPHQIQAITGATISSKAVAKLVSNGVAHARQVWLDQPEVP